MTEKVLRLIVERDVKSVEARLKTPENTHAVFAD